MLIRAVALLLRIGSRRAVHLRRCIAVDRMDTEERARLGPLLYEIFCASFGALPLEVVVEEFAFRPGGHLNLWYDGAGRLVGFTTNDRERLRTGGRESIVAAGGAHFLPGYSPGARLRLLNLAFVCSERLRHPCTPVYAAIEAGTPVSYVWLTRIFVWLYPNWRRPTPPGIRALAEVLIDARGLSRVEGRPFVVRYDNPFTHTRELVSARILEQRDTAHYLSLNPDYRDGHVLLVLIPMTALNLLGAACPPLARALRALLAHRRSLTPRRGTLEDYR